MNITVKRKAESYGGMMKLKMHINGEYSGKIAAGEEKAFTLPAENATLQVKQLNGKSNKLTVNDGDSIVISNSHSILWVFLLAIILMTITGSYEGTSWVLGLILSVILIIGALFVIETFVLSKVNQD